MKGGGYFAVDDSGDWRGGDLAATIAALARRGLVAGADIRVDSEARARRLRADLADAGAACEILVREGVLAAARRLRRRLRESGASFLFLAGGRARLAAALRPPPPALPIVLPEDSRRPARGFVGLAERLAEGLVLARAVVLCAGAAPRPRAGRPRRAISVGWGPPPGPPPSPKAEATGRVGLWTPPGSAAATRRMLEAFRALAATDERLRLVVLVEEDRASLSPWPDDLGLTGRVERRSIGESLPAALADLDQLWVHAGGEGLLSREPDPRVALAALARGCPVIIDHQTSLAAGIREIGGALMRDGAWPQQFAEAGLEIFRDAELRAALRRAGPILVAERHGRERYLDRLSEALAGL